MIEINLIPVPLRKKSSSGGLSLLPLDLPVNMLLAGGAVLALLIMAHALLLVKLGIDAAVLAGHKNAWEKILPQKNTIDSLGQQIRDLKKKEQDIAGLTSGKAVGWSRKLNVVSDNVDKGMWLSRVAVDGNGLAIEGSVISREQNEIGTVSAFVNSLKSDSLFMQDFGDLEINSIQKQKRGATEIADFKLTAKYKAVEEKKVEKK